MKDRYFGNILVVVGIAGFIGLLLNGCSKNLVQEIQKSGQLTQSIAPPSFTRILSATHRTPGEIRVAWDKAHDSVTPAEKMTYRVYFLKDAGNLESRQLLKTLIGENELYIKDARARGVSTLLIEAVNEFGRAAQQMVTVQPAPSEFQASEPMELANVNGTVLNPGDPDRTVYIGLFNSEENPTQSRGNVHPFAMTSGKGPEIPFIFNSIPRGTKVWIGAYLDSRGRGAVGPESGDVVGFWPSFAAPEQVVAGSQLDNLRFKLSDRLMNPEKRLEMQRVDIVNRPPVNSPVVLPVMTPVGSGAATPVVPILQQTPADYLPPPTPLTLNRQIVKIDIRIEGQISTRKPDVLPFPTLVPHPGNQCIPPDHTLRLPVKGTIHLRESDIGKTLLVFAERADQRFPREGNSPVEVKKYTVNDDHVRYELVLEAFQKYWIRASLQSDDDGIPEPGDRRGSYPKPVEVSIHNRAELENIDFLVGENMAFCPEGHPIPFPNPTYFPMPTYSPTPFRSSTVLGEINVGDIGPQNVLHIAVYRLGMSGYMGPMHRQRIENVGSLHHYTFMGVPLETYPYVNYGGGNGAGIQPAFMPSPPDYTRNVFKVVAFLDSNRNGVCDAGERWGESEPVTLEEAMRTNANFALNQTGPLPANIPFPVFDPNPAPFPIMSPFPGPYTYYPAPNEMRGY